MLDQSPGTPDTPSFLGGSFWPSADLYTSNLPHVSSHDVPVQAVDWFDFDRAQWEDNPMLGSTALKNPWRDAPYVARPRQQPLPIWEHAAPLSPLRDRDLAELRDWFQREDMPELEQDVNYRLLLLFPEPCWEDADWLFLQEIL